MEKLLKLLSESTNGRFKTEQDLRLCIEMRGYCRDFIKWLVDNDKIDRSKFYDKNILKGFMTLTNEEKADSIIMNLSIQDKPIDFLISILK